MERKTEREIGREMNREKFNRGREGWELLRGRECSREFRCAGMIPVSSRSIL
jgi:hypothetical protein